MAFYDTVVPVAQDWGRAFMEQVNKSAQDPLTMSVLAQLGGALGGNTPVGDVGRVMAKLWADQAKGKQLVQGAVGTQAPPTQPQAPIAQAQPEPVPQVQPISRIAGLPSSTQSQVSVNPSQPQLAPTSQTQLGGTSDSTPVQTRTPAKGIIPGNMVQQIAAGPKRVGNPLSGYVNEDPGMWAATGDPLNTFAQVLNAQAARQAAENSEIARYQQFVEGMKQMLAMPTAQREIEKAKEGGKISAQANEVERVAEQYGATPLPAEARAATGLNTWGQAFRLFNTTDPKMVNTLLDAWTKMRTGEMRAESAIRSAGLRAGAENRLAISTLLSVTSRDLENARARQAQLAAALSVSPETPFEERFKMVNLLNQKILTPDQAALAKTLKEGITRLEALQMGLAKIIAPEAASALRTAPAPQQGADWSSVEKVKATLSGNPAVAFASKTPINGFTVYFDAAGRPVAKMAVTQTQQQK